MTTLASAKRIIVKVGSSLVTNEGRGLDESAIRAWSEQLAALTAQGLEVIMVSSGAIAEGMKDSKRVIILTPASLRANYIEELKKCGDLLYKRNVPLPVPGFDLDGSLLEKIKDDGTEVRFVINKN